MKWTNNNTQNISLFSPKVHPSALDLCRSKINPSRALDVPWMMNPCGNYPGRSCETEVCVSPLQWSHANTTFQNTKQHSSNISCTIYTQHPEKWKEKSDNTSYLRLFQACTQPHTFSFNISQISNRNISTKMQCTYIHRRKEGNIWQGIVTSSIFRKHAFFSNILTISNL